MKPIKPINKWMGALILGGGTTGIVLGAGALAEQEVRPHQQVTQKELARAEDMADVFRSVGKRVEPSVVEIQVRKTVKTAAMEGPEEFFHKAFPDFNLPDMPERRNQGHDSQGGTMEQVGTGSGVIVEVDGKTGYILTNNHVAGGATDMTVTLADGRRIDNAKLVGADPKTDLAVVKIEADNLQAAQLGQSDDLQQGDWVMAFGAPFGYVGSMTHGIISALDRSQVGILGSGGYEDFIQVDAPINPGNSGGPLVNLHGQVIGINAAIASQNGGFQGVGFAIPIDEAKWIYGQLKDHGKVTRGWLGVAIADVSQARDVAKGVGYEHGNGALVEQVVSDSPAKNKLDVYDVITAVNGKPIQNATQLRNVIAEQSPGAKVDLTVFRNGKDEDVSLKLGTQPKNLQEASTPWTQNDNSSALGMTLTKPADGLAEKYGLPANSQGAVITSVKTGSAAERAGLQPGDMITQVDRKPVTDPSDVSRLIDAHKKNSPVLLYVQTSQGGRIVALEK